MVIKILMILFIVFFGWVFATGRLNNKKYLYTFYSFVFFGFVISLFKIYEAINATPTQYFINLATSSGLPNFIFFLLALSFFIFFTERQKYNLLNLIAIILLVCWVLMGDNLSIKDLWIFCLIQYTLIVLTKIPVVNKIQYRRLTKFSQNDC